MHVLREQDGLVRLETAVFLEDDLLRVNAAALDFGRELAGLVIREAAGPVNGRIRRS